MLDLSQFLTVSGLAVLLGLVVQFLKRYVPPARSALIPWLALGLGVALAPTIGLALGDTTAQQLTSLAITGLLAGLSSVGLYQATANNVASLNVGAKPPTPLAGPPPPALHN